jgi:hypothetical protein
MSFNGSHTIYNLGNQSLDLVLTTEGIKTDNRPMNQNKLTVHKGFNNKLSFFVRNRDRALQNISTKTLYATIMNPNTKRRIMLKQLTLVNSGTTGEATLDLVPSDLNNIGAGLYTIAITESADDGESEYPLYANQNDRIVTDLEVKSSLEYEPIATQETTTFTQTANTDLGDAANTFVTSAMFGNMDNNQNGSHTCAFYLTDFTGNIHLQGSALETTPSADTDWYDINVQGDLGEPSIPITTATTIVDPYNFKINTNWIRVKYHPTAGTIDKFQLRN